MVYTFYSYKGGVGRTHLLANMAAYLCYYQARKVLMIDWDLEAPGLHFYFGKKNEDIEVKGLLDLLNSHIDLLLRADKNQKLSEDDFYNPYEQEKEKYIQNLVSADNGGKIDLMPAIAYTEGYHTEVEEFDWVKSYEKFYIGSYLLWLKEKLKKQYDYIFIDSRTGFNDYSGICNVLMPDMNVILVAPNEQNFEGAKTMAKRIINSPYTKSEARKPFVLPILSRLDRENEIAKDWIDKFCEEFAFLISELDEDIKAYKEEVLEQITAQTLLYYNRNFAIGEKLLFKKEARRIKEAYPEKNFENIALHFLEEMNQIGEVNLNKIVGDKMIPVYLRNIKKNPEDYESYFGLGNAYYGIANYTEAEKYYLKAIESKADKHKAWNNLGNTYIGFAQFSKDLKEYNKAIEAFKKAIEIKADYHLAWYNLGNVYFNIENYSKAIEAFQKAIEIKADYYKAWNNLGNVYVKSSQNYPKAIEAYRKAIEIKADFHEAWNNLGFVYLKLEDYTKAKEHFEKAIKIQTDYDNAIFNLACAYSLEQNKEQALEYLQKAIELNPEWKEKATKDTDFEWLWEDSDFLGLVSPPSPKVGE